MSKQQGQGSLLLIGIVVLTVIAGLIYYQILSTFKFLDQDQSNYTLDYSEGNCSKDADCEWAGEGCGGGHGICTNQPEKYRPISTCDVNLNFPANRNYTCGCITSLEKCGWKEP